MLHQDATVVAVRSVSAATVAVSPEAPTVLVTVKHLTPPRVGPVEDAPTFAPFEIDEDTYDEAIRMRYGWCPSCEEFTRRDIHPRASARACSECFDGRVCGAIHARRAGFIWVSS